MLSLCGGIINSPRTRTSRLGKGKLHLSMGTLSAQPKALPPKTKSDTSHPNPHRIKSVQSTPPLSLLIFNGPNGSAITAAKTFQHRRFCYSIPVSTQIPDLTYAKSATNASSRLLHFWSTRGCTQARNPSRAKFAERGLEKVVICGSTSGSMKGRKSLHVKSTVAVKCFYAWTS